MVKKYLSLALSAASVTLSAAEFLGADKYWRPRENMVFYLDDETGGGFELKIDLRDMNTYCEGERHAYVFVIGPDGRIVNRRLLPDDGVTKNDPNYKDGCADIFLDFRYREYHRHNSPNGTPPGKERSPFLAEPQKLPARTFTLKIPDAGKGIYRLAVAGCWDHWFSVTPSRKMSAAIHPGQGGVYLHGNQMAESWLWIPGDAKEISLALTEETQPFQCRATAEVDGKTLAEVQGRHFYKHQILQNIPAHRILRLKTSGGSPGCMIHVLGIPAIFCDSAATASKIAGGVNEPSLEILRKYARSLSADNNIFPRIVSFGNALGFGNYDAVGMEFGKAKNTWRFRSSWWDFGDGNNVIPQGNMPPQIKTALTDLYEKWTLNRYVMELGTCTNQWGKILENMAGMYEYTKSPLILEALRFNVKRMCTKNSLGRVNPDRDSFLSGYEPDAGRIDNGIMGECLGHDNEYNLETDAHMSQVYATTKQAEILDYQSAYYALKTHLTLSRTGGLPMDIFKGSCSPTDSNFRTRFYTHKTGALLDLIPYGDLWGGTKNPKKTTWPFLEKKPFSRNLEGRYHAVNTGKYYVLFYTGPSFPRWQSWSVPRFEGDTMEFAGFHGMGYGGWQAHANKSGGLSALWMPDLGPVLLANNHNVMYSNTTWGETMTPSAPLSSPNVNAYITADAYCDASGRFDEKNNVFLRSGVIPGTPLHFERRVTVLKHELKVEVVFKAESAFRMKSLYETIPFFADRRTLKSDGTAVEIPEAATSPLMSVNTETEGLRGGNTEFKGSKLTLNDAVEIRFDKPYEMILSTPIRYRDIAAAMSGLNLKLPVEWTKGMCYRLEYTIRCGND